MIDANSSTQSLLILIPELGYQPPVPSEEQFTTTMVTRVPLTTSQSQQSTESTMLLGSTLNLKFSTIKSTKMPLIPTTLKTLSHISAMPQFNFHQHLASPLMPETVNTPLQITL